MSETNNSATELAPEVEETLETSLVGLLSASCTIPVCGYMSPASTGSVKQLNEDTFIGVKVEQSSQDGDYVYRSPCTYAATISVHYSQADDADGRDFRDECRRVRHVLDTFIGDGCNALDTECFSCAEFIMSATDTNFGGADNPTFTKSYTATIKGRKLTTTTEAENGN